MHVVRLSSEKDYSFFQHHELYSLNLLLTTHFLLCYIIAGNVCTQLNAIKTWY